MPGAAWHVDLIRRYAEAVYAWGWQHAEFELSRMRAALQEFADPGPRGPKPVEATAWAAARTELAGKWNRDLDARVNEIIVQGLDEGLSNRDIMKRLQQVFPDFSKARLENIARTETASAYNAGRLAVLGRSRFVVAVQFTAILDDRTSDICRARDGKIMLLSDPRLAANTPPLHFQCRSTIVPVDRFDLEDLQNGDPQAEERFFGHLKKGPRNFAEATNWDGLPDPLAGFGGSPASPATPAPAPTQTRREDFLGLAHTVKGATPELVDRWNEFFGDVTPGELFGFIKTTNDTAAETLEFKTFAKAFSFDLDTKIQGQPGYSLARTFRLEFYGQSLEKVVDHDAFLIYDSKRQGKGLGAHIMGHMMEYYQRAGVSRLEVNATLDNGGYTWARFAFKIYPQDIKSLRSQIVEKVGQAQWSETERRDFLAMLNKLDVSDPMFAIYASALQRSRDVMSGTKWSGYFDLGDPEQMAAFWAYVRFKTGK